jgi:hypothetical protein
MYHKFQHNESSLGDNTDFQNEDASFVIDCPVSSIQAYATNF